MELCLTKYLQTMVKVWCEQGITTILSNLSMTLGKFGDNVSALKLPCCQGQLGSFPRVTFRGLDIMSDKAHQNLQMVTVKFKLATATS